jgi:hypothetical protein
MGVDADVTTGRLAALKLKGSPILLDIDIVVSRERTPSPAEQAFLAVLMENLADNSSPFEAAGNSVGI